MTFHLAPDIQSRIKIILKALDLQYIDAKRIICVRSHGSTSRARARIWSFPRIWQLALNLKAHYLIEVISEKFDKLNYEDQVRVLIHELLHIPKTFSGALLPHRGRGKRRIDQHTIEVLFKKLQTRK